MHARSRPVLLFERLLPGSCRDAGRPSAALYSVVNAAGLSTTRRQLSADHHLSCAAKQGRTLTSEIRSERAWPPAARAHARPRNRRAAEQRNELASPHAGHRASSRLGARWLIDRMLNLPQSGRQVPGADLSRLNRGGAALCRCLSLGQFKLPL